MKLLRIFFIVLLLYLLSSTFSSMLAQDLAEKIVIIPIKGTIGTSGGLLSGGGGISADEINEKLDKANEDKLVKGIILEINSGGGTVVGSAEIVDKVKSIDKPMVAWIRDTGASGAYWIASACDKIVAHPMSVTGSVGVLGSYLEYSGLMEQYGVRYEQMTSGEFKDMGSPFRQLVGKERELLQGKLKTIHEYFIDDVMKNRKLKDRSFANGAFFLGIEAKNMGLVDVLGGEAEAKKLIKDLARADGAKFVKMDKKDGIIQLLSLEASKQSYSFGMGIGDSFNNQVRSGMSFLV